MLYVQIHTYIYIHVCVGVPVRHDTLFFMFDFPRSYLLAVTLHRNRFGAMEKEQTNIPLSIYVERERDVDIDICMVGLHLLFFFDQ